jgi:multicomponent Na+:H+ antiporter subunit D
LEAPLQLLLVTWLVALLNIFFGLFPGVPLELANSAAALLLGHAS